MSSYRNYSAMSDRDVNPQFRRRWIEPTTRNENRRPVYQTRAAEPFARLSIELLTDARRNRAAA